MSLLYVPMKSIHAMTNKDINREAIQSGVSKHRPDSDYFVMVQMSENASTYLCRGQ